MTVANSIKTEISKYGGFSLSLIVAALGLSPAEQSLGKSSELVFSFQVFPWNQKVWSGDPAPNRVWRWHRWARLLPKPQHSARGRLTEKGAQGASNRSQRSHKSTGGWDEVNKFHFLHFFFTCARERLHLILPCNTTSLHEKICIKISQFPSCPGGALVWMQEKLWAAQMQHRKCRTAMALPKRCWSFPLLKSSRK